MGTDGIELDFCELEAPNFPELLKSAAKETLNLARTMALSGTAMGQRAWQDEMAALHLITDEKGTRLTGIRISAAMKRLKGWGAVEPPVNRSLSGVWMKRSLVVATLKDWSEADPKEMRKAVFSRRTQHDENSRQRRYRFYGGYDPITNELSTLSLCFGYCFTEQWGEVEAFMNQSKVADLKYSIATFLVDQFDWKVFSHFSDQFAGYLSKVAFEETISELNDPAKLVSFLDQDRFLHSLRNCGELEVLRGNFKEANRFAEALLSENDPLGKAYGSALKAWLAFLRGEDKEVLVRYEQAMAALVEGTRKKKAYPGGLSSPFALLGLIRSGDPAALTKANRFLPWGKELGSDLGVYALDQISGFLRLQSLHEETRIEEMCRFLIARFIKGYDEIFSDLLSLLSVHWTVPELLVENEKLIVPSLLEYVKRAGEHGYTWIEMEASHLVSAISQNEDEATKAGELAEKIRSSLSFAPVPLIDLATPVPAWEKSIATLESLIAATGESAVATATSGGGNKQFLWGLEKSYYGSEYHLLPFERTLLKSGKWSVPKKVSLHRLFDHFRGWEHLSRADRKIIETFENNHRNRWSGYGMDDITTSISGVLSYLVDHPAVYLADEKPNLARPARIVEIEPSIALTESKKGVLSLQIHPFSTAFDVGEVYFAPLQNDVLEYCVITKTLHDMCLTFPTPRSREFPVEARERLGAVLGALSGSIRVEGDAAATSAEGAREIAAGETLYLRMMPQGEGLIVTARVQPLGPDGPGFAPGHGSEAVFGRDDDGPVRAVRDLKEESRSLKNLVAHSEILSSRRNENNTVWTLTDLESCLQLLLEIREMPADSKPVVEWPDGEALTLKALAGAESFSLRLNSKSDWLEASGELQVDENTVLTMQNLLRLMDSSIASRFIRLDDGQYLALTERLRRQIRDIGALAREEPTGDNGVYQLPTLTAHLIEDLAVEAGATTNPAWKKRLEKLEEAGRLRPKIPPTLQAELRPYQNEGFEWLARLAHWTGGACLADDMGLGKTVQALALLLHRAADGPALIVAPVSVASNWADETLRFAPTLNLKVFRGPNRSELLGELGPRDLVIVTYGLLQSEADLFAGIEWNTVVIDEAQAIKNRETLRYKAAIRLRARFRLITTGTPIENHLEELYNLFHFIQPGLLGNVSRFQKKFAVPIEQQQHAETRDRLRRLINPFILRRLKSDVLRDLPEKTEITLKVELSDEETAFYEAIRRNAVEMMDTHADEKGAVRILAELMKLRRACCNPAMIDPVNAPASSKLKVFRNTLEELLSNDHKVLVFSQFVDHLSLLREHLDEEGVSYQYLDGSTSPKKRKTAIDAFQSGDGDVFLISLKAGGFGLNLTAADYVIHMDPWWNPAVEDQASDRAHRIGQTRPVTIYRIVAANTIEEKIVSLHHRKRELADSLLSGTDAATKLTVDQLKSLLIEES